MYWLSVVIDTVDVIAFFVVENRSAVLGFIMAVLGILFAFQLPRKYVLSKLSFGTKQSLPIGFDDPEWLAGKDGLRARLRADIQTYVAAPKELGIFKLRSCLEDHTRPLVITGDGGLGKTRLALELYRASGFRGVLVQKHASLEDVKSIIEDARLNKCRTLLIIDYIEQMGSLYDGIHQAIISQSKGYAFLITTTRTLSNGSATMHGPVYLNSRACQEISLNDRLLLPWRKQVCEEILTNAKVPEPLRSQAIDSAVPLIATLVSYDFSNHGMTDNKSDKDDGYWLVKRLRRHIDDNLADEDFTCLLCLYPMNKAIREGLPKPLRKASDMLQRQGWVSTTGSGKAMQWHLGHDLLCDIPLVHFLVTEPDIVLRLEAIERLGEHAQSLQGDYNLAIALSRALKKIIMETPAQHIVPTLAASAQQIALTSKERDTALEMVDKSIYSLSLGLGEKLRIITELRGLSHFQVDELLSTFNEELETLIKLVKEHPEDIYLLISNASMGCEHAYNRLYSSYALTHYQQPYPPIGLTGKYIPDLYIIDGDITKLLDEFPADDGLSNDLRGWVAEKLYLSATSIKRDDLYHFVIERYKGSSNIELKFYAAKAMFAQSHDIAERDNNPDAYNKVIDLYRNDEHGEIRLQAAKAMFNQSNVIAQRDNNPDAYNDVIDLCRNDEHDEIRLRAVWAMFNQSVDIAQRDNNPDAYNKVIDLYRNDEHGEIRLQAAKAMFNQSHDIAKRDNNPDAYNKVIDLYRNDEHDEVRLRAVWAMFNQSADIAKRDNNPDAYNKIIDLYCDDEHDEIRLAVANAMFNQSNNIAKRDSNPDAYNKVIDLYRNDEHDEIRLQAAKAMFNQSDDIAQRDNNPNAYNAVIAAYAEDTSPAIQAKVQSARAARIGWSVVAQQYPQAIKLADKFLVDYATDCVNCSVVAFLAWLANRTQDNQQRYEKIAQGLGTQRTNWTFDEFAQLIATFPEQDKHYAYQAIERLEHSYEERPEPEAKGIPA
ncbi:HEAT repeat domain-containing protein [Pseudoalteromonas sp. JBTF-M23]|uniref:HEAT repeat domain-containing protein n=1 Tax=Pseudoalteromonas caenipelagi TaxID=2726988 RepID=A0A849VKR9_9GAMM|nr:HEAT repeat domain-containing protein [Pseudoalteromonas caenipelagi]NOU52207.1 HEAT repeat domain-containing protein [Pseudoalteromonas caenipelagi]